MSRSRLEARTWKRLAKKDRWTEADGRAAVEAWQRSGLPLQRFAREKGLPWWRVRWWWRKLVRDSSQESKRKPARPSEEVRFVPAIVTGAGMSHEAAVVVRFPDGLEVEVRHGEQPRPEEVARLVAQLRRAGG
jgi:hypothetical protein